MNYTKLTIKLNSLDKPPYFVGSELRGAFGYALKSVSSELYDRIFSSTRDDIRPFRFDIRLGMSAYEFSFYLFDSACDNVYDIINSFHEMLTKVGLGEDNKIYKDFTIFLNDKLIYDGKNLKTTSKYKQKFEVKKHKKDILLRFETPLRMKKGNFLIRNSRITLEDVLYSIYKRKRVIENKTIKRLPFEPSYICRSKSVTFKDLSRKSNAQNAYMKFGGLLGEMWISDLDKKSYKLLKLGELIGVGKQCVFGLGKINIGEVK